MYLGRGARMMEFFPVAIFRIGMHVLNISN
jgi:hypothetical protein